MSNRARRHAQMLDLQVKLKSAETQLVAAKDELRAATIGRDAAIAGVLPYVQAAQAFNEWVGLLPPQESKAVQAGLKRCGLLGIKVGNAPPHEPNWFELLQEWNALNDQ